MSVSAACHGHLGFEMVAVELHCSIVALVGADRADWLTVPAETYFIHTRRTVVRPDSREWIASESVGVCSASAIDDDPWEQLTTWFYHILIRGRHCCNGAGAGTGTLARCATR